MRIIRSLMLAIGLVTVVSAGALMVPSSSQAATVPTVPHINAPYVALQTGKGCVSDHCVWQYYDYVPVPGSHACATYHGHTSCVTWRRVVSHGHGIESMNGLVPVGALAVVPSPSTLRLSNGQLFHEFSMAYWDHPVDPGSASHPTMPVA